MKRTSHILPTLLLSVLIACPTLPIRASLEPSPTTKVAPTTETTARRKDKKKNRRQTPETFDVRNSVVKRFFATATTNLLGTGKSWDRADFVADGNYRPDQPATKTITLSGNTQHSTLLMATDKDYKQIVLNEDVTGQRHFTLRNFVPGKTYYYKEVDERGRTLTSGALTATGQLRMIAIDNGFNIRDLGGWTGLDGRTVRYEKIYRGGTLGGVDMNGDSVSTDDKDKFQPSPADKQELHRLGIRAQLDLRASQNQGRYRGEYSHHSYARGYITMLDADYNNTMTDNGAYAEDASVVCDIAWIIYELRRGRPVYFNCRQGADRTGTIAFIIEGLLGCFGEDGSQMARDYELTCFSQADLIDNKKADCYRIAHDITGGHSKLFSKLLHSISPDTTLQQACYRYLTQHWEGYKIPNDDVDWFIRYMLGSTDELGTPSPELKRIAESRANVVTYVQQ